jgi:hypothetical protein
MSNQCILSSVADLDSAVVLHRELTITDTSFADENFTAVPLNTSVFIKVETGLQGVGLAFYDNAKDLSSVPLL